MRLMMRTVCTCSVEDMGMGTTGIHCWCKASALQPRSFRLRPWKKENHSCLVPGSEWRAIGSCGTITEDSLFVQERSNRAS